MDEKLAELERLGAAASAPPWTCGPTPYYEVTDGEGRPVRGSWFGCDARFIAAARTAVPDLIAFARRLSLDNAALRAEVESLRAALAPFAAVRLPDSWPGGCVVDWREGEGSGGRYAYAGYLDIDARGGPTVDDYRRARSAGG